VSPVVRAGTADDHALVTAAQSGDRRALEILLNQHYDRIWRLCRRLAGNDADGQDAAQEALIAIARGLPRFDGRAAFTTWSYRVATNACLDELRRRSRRPDPMDQNEAPAMIGLLDPATTAAPEQIVERQAIDRALRHLPEDYRVAVVLRDLCDLDYAEIGEVLGIPPGTVRSRIARGRAQLTEHLRPESGNPPDHPQRPTPQP
jgi:RNA polymerase sigma-70 factor, ECF subfamily